MVTENCKKIEPIVVKLRSKTNIPLFSEHGVETLLTNQPVIDDLILSSTSRVCVQYHIAVAAEHLTGVFTFQLDGSVRRVFSSLHTPDLTSTPHFSTHTTLSSKFALSRK